MDFVLQPYPAITFTTIGGIIDLFVYMGPRPSDVLRQHLDTIGRPFMPSYFTLGFHLSRWNYANDTHLSEVIKRMRKSGIPYDTQWADIDVMKELRDWTYDDINFARLSEIVKDLMSMVNII
jgi:alpha-glucosidase (family GH31 glycosyl hydrolase)